MNKSGRCTCKGRSGERKTLYRTRNQAFNIRVRYGNSKPFRTYKCPKQDGYHVTTKGC